MKKSNKNRKQNKKNLILYQHEALRITSWETGKTKERKFHKACSFCPKLTHKSTSACLIFYLILFKMTWVQD